MKRTILAVCGAVVMSAALAGAQSNSQNDSNSKSDANAKAETVTFTGCLSPGTTGDTYYLTSAKQKGVKNPATTLKVLAGTAATKKVSLDPYVRQEVEVVGTLDQPAATGDSGKAATLTVTKVKVRADAC